MIHAMIRFCLWTPPQALAALLLVATAAWGQDIRPLPDPGEGTEALKDFAPPTRAEILDSAGETVPGQERVPRVRIAIDGDVYLGAWRKLEGSPLAAKSAMEARTLELEWAQLA